MIRKNRIKYAVIVLVIIILGICSRKFSNQLPFFIADNSGDFLWAAMVYFGFRCFFINKSLAWAFVAGLAFSFFIELSQLYQADWIISLRHTTLGGLVLGKGFLWVDLLRYFFGIIIAWLADFFILKPGAGISRKYY
ncbi:DUF2809 domain-containing protein [Marivirga sp. S37H4]|uniref:DUF2809 domain-containing protein n=1 Tax=Marivirga aurantiaca TaxID=2802615 RepID=A0A934WXY6_9BACT|nr:DUF2809 domain-containing protein [Marivirga aurantiaca]MBK6265218.1 DUF2809 domain-containing protein [Marivirga aurantiaca]